MTGVIGRQVEVRKKSRVVAVIEELLAAGVALPQNAIDIREILRRQIAAVQK
jgi:hypothetical protein